MADKASFTLRLIDRVKGPARAVNASIGKIIAANGRLARSTRSTEKATGRFTDAAGRLREANGRFVKGAGKRGSLFGGAFDVFKGNLLTMAAQKLTSLASTVASTGFEMLTFGQNARLGFSNLAKHGEDPAKLFEHSRELAKRFGLDVLDTTKQYQKFLALQFTPRGIDKLVRMGADLRALGVDAEGVQGVFMALGQIRGKGRLQGEELLQLAERGISTALVQEEIGKALGGKDQKQVQKMIQGGKVTADVAFMAIENAINRKLNQGELGESGARFADQTISGMLGRFRSYFQAGGLQAFDKAAAPITKVLGKTLDDFMAFMDSPRGAKLIEDIAGSLERMAGAAADFGGALGKSIIEADWKAIGQDIADITDGIIAAARAAGELARMLGFGGGGEKAKADVTGGGGGRPNRTSDHASVLGFAAAGAATGLIFGPWGALLGGSLGAGMALLENVGVDMGHAMADGMASPQVGESARAAGHALGREASAGSKDALGIHSPSKVAMQDGRMWTRGLAIGMQREGWRVSSAHEGFADQALSSFSVGPQMASLSPQQVDGAGRGPSRINVTLHTEVHGASGDAEEVGRVAARETRREIESFFRQLSLEA